MRFTHMYDIESWNISEIMLSLPERWWECFALIVKWICSVLDGGVVTLVKTGFVRLFETQAYLMNPYGCVNAFSLYTFPMCVTLIYHNMFVFSSLKYWTVLVKGKTTNWFCSMCTVKLENRDVLVLKRLFGPLLTGSAINVLLNIGIFYQFLKKIKK